jgi:hypothetical protein
MRLARPVYETLPLLYVAIGAVGFVLAYLDTSSRRAMLAFVIGLLAEIAALTVFLRRQDCRALRKEYSGESIDFPSTLQS